MPRLAYYPVRVWILWNTPWSSGSVVSVGVYYARAQVALWKSKSSLWGACVCAVLHGSGTWFVYACDYPSFSGLSAWGLYYCTYSPLADLLSPRTWRTVSAA